MNNLKKKDMVYYARIMPSLGIYDICELRVRTIEDTYFVGVDKRDKHAYVFNNNSINKTIFIDRKDALKLVKEAEKNRKHVISETYYEEY